MQQNDTMEGNLLGFDYEAFYDDHGRAVLEVGGQEFVVADLNDAAIRNAVNDAFPREDQGRAFAAAKGLVEMVKAALPDRPAYGHGGLARAGRCADGPVRFNRDALQRELERIAGRHGVRVPQAILNDLNGVLVRMEQGEFAN